MLQFILRYATSRSTSPEIPPVTEFDEKLPLIQDFSLKNNKTISRAPFYCIIDDSKGFR